MAKHHTGGFRSMSPSIIRVAAECLISWTRLAGTSASNAQVLEGRGVLPGVEELASFVCKHPPPRSRLPYLGSEPLGGLFLPVGSHLGRQRGRYDEGTPARLGLGGEVKGAVDVEGLPAAGSVVVPKIGLDKCCLRLYTHYRFRNTPRGERVRWPHS
jgi:hypothetical protein